MTIARLRALLLRPALIPPIFFVLGFAFACFKLPGVASGLLAGGLLVEMCRGADIDGADADHG